MLGNLVGLSTSKDVHMFRILGSRFSSLQNQIYKYRVKNDCQRQRKWGKAKWMKGSRRYRFLLTE